MAAAASSVSCSRLVLTFEVSGDRQRVSAMYSCSLDMLDGGVVSI